MLPAFPHFKALSLDDKAEYDKLVAEYPPFSDISFATLHIWWNLEGQLRLSQLHGNLVIDYQLSTDPENSGLSLIGKSRLEESIQAIFSFLKSEGRPVKLVHVPEFVIKEIGSRLGLDLTEELNYNEYILDSHGLASLESALHGRTRRKVGRFMRAIEDREVEIKELDLSSDEVRRQVWESIQSWAQAFPSATDPRLVEHEAIQKSLDNSQELGVQSLGLYLDGQLYAVILYHAAHDSNHYILNHLKVDYSIPYIFDYMIHHVAGKASKEGIDFLNMEMDLGIESLRHHKMRLRPINFFRKYTITPAAE